MSAIACRYRVALATAFAAALVACAQADRPPNRAETSTPAATTSRPQRPLPPIPAGFAVLGADAYTIERLFGPPSMRRREPPAEYWRYDFPRCTLDLFLFRAPEDPAPRVVYFELREHGPAAAMQGCREIEAALQAPAGKRSSGRIREH